jgi:chromosome segregation ATPase
MVNIYSINEILEASNKILESTNDIKNGPFENIPLIDIKVLKNKKDFNVLTDKPPTIKRNDSKKDIPEVLEKIILEAERSQLNTNKTINDRTNHKEKKNLSEQNKINQKDLIDDLYKTFGKKIKRNSLKLILELRNDIIHLTKDISKLKINKSEIEQKNIKLNRNIDNLKDEESNLKNNLDQSINGFNKLNYEHKNLKLTFNKIEENLLDNNKKLNETVETNNQLNHNLKRSKESFNTLYDNHKDLKLNFSTVEEDLNYKKKKLSISGELNEKLENKIKNLENKLIEYKDIELDLSSKVEKLENYIFRSNTKNDELSNQNKNLEKNNTELKTKIDSVGHIDVYLDEINQLKLKNKDLENTIEKLKSYEDNNDQNINIIKELENKIKYYQEENIRISNQLYEANKRFDIIKSEIEVLQDQRSSLIAKINSVNDVIGNSKIVTNVFQNSQPQNTKVSITDPKMKIEKQSKDIDEEILDIFSK